MEAKPSVIEDMAPVPNQSFAPLFALLLYSASARAPNAPPGLTDWTQLALVGTALVVDTLALWAIGSRTVEFGLTPNRVAFSRLCDWQTLYLYVLAAWAAVVALLFPLVFGFV